MDKDRQRPDLSYAVTVASINPNLPREKVSHSQSLAFDARGVGRDYVDEGSPCCLALG
jgi:hypothetical protein